MVGGPRNGSDGSRSEFGNGPNSGTKNAEKKKELILNSFGKRRVLQNSLWEFSCVLQYFEGLFRETVWHHFFLHIFFLCIFGSQRIRFRRVTRFRAESAVSFCQPIARHRQVTDLDVTVLGFSGPGLPSVRQVLCGHAPRLFCIILVCIQGVSWGGQSSVMRSGLPGPKKPTSSAMKTTTWHCSILLVCQSALTELTHQVCRRTQ